MHFDLKKDLIGVTQGTPVWNPWQSSILDRRYWIPIFVSGTWILDSGFLELYSGFQSLEIRDSTSKNFPDSRIRILFNEGVHCGPQIRQK